MGLLQPYKSPNLTQVMEQFRDPAKLKGNYSSAVYVGILGFGGDKHDGYKPQFEGSAAYLINRNLAVGAEYRTKPDNLNIAREDNAWDAFVAWAPTKHVSLTVAYVDLGNIVIRDNQRGWYASRQVGF